MTTRVTVGLVGCGFMGRAHTDPFRQVGRFFDNGFEMRLGAVCARNGEKAEDFARRWGFERSETGWRKLIESPDIDLVDIASPNDTHSEIAIAAAAAGKMVACEKPLGRDAAESGAMVEAVARACLANMVWYNYRRVPAAALARRLIEDGRLGRVFHCRAKFLQDCTMSADLPQGGETLWRLDGAVAGSRVAGDLLAHCIDMAMWLNGPIREVSVMTKTFVTERTHALTGASRPCRSTTPARFWRASATGPSERSRRRATPAATRRSTPSKSTARTRPLRGTCTIFIGCNGSTIATTRTCAARAP